MPTPLRSVREIFLEAIERANPVERSEYLDRMCAGDAELRRHLESLIGAHEEPDSFLDRERIAPGMSLDLETTKTVVLSERPGDEIGPYKLLEQIGDGGFGVVFMAEQLRPVRRKVALKILKAGMDTKQVVARFEAERQSLALMDDPHIARVFDAGTTESGRPYFAMELIKGGAITTFCDERRLNVRERLTLFIDVCRAIQHAHQRGIIHRDIKPSNILVTLLDGTPQVKVIDFGIAKAMGPRLTDKTLFTGFAQLIGTPTYMSPEQTGFSAIDVDTRSDVYSLGVLLYELLTGTTPFDKEALLTAGYDELRRIIREEEPPTPSTRISTLGNQHRSTLAERRQVDSSKLTSQLRGELDWIVMKPLEKDRQRRYQSAGDFAADVQRYLDGKVVEACPPSTWYRFRKTARRHRTALTSLVIVVASLITGVVVSAAQTIDARKARQLAEERLILANQRLESEQAALREVEKEKKRAAASFEKAFEAVRQMLQRVAVHDVARIPAMKPIYDKLLEDATRFYGDLIKLNPEDARCYFERAEVYDYRLMHAESFADYERAIALNPNYFEPRLRLGGLISGTEPKRALELLKRAIELNPNHPKVHWLRALALASLGRAAEAKKEILLYEALAGESAETSCRLADFFSRPPVDEGLVEHYTRKAVDQDPTNSHAHYYAAQLKSRTAEERLASVNRAIELNPLPNETSHAFALRSLRGDIYCELGRDREALADYDEALRLQPRGSDSFHNRRAFTHFRLKNFDAAYMDFARAWELSTGDKGRYYWYELRELAHCPDDELRERMLNLLRKQDPLSTGHIDFLAEMDRFAEAFEVAAQVVQHSPGDLRAQRMYAMLAIKFGRLDLCLAQRASIRRALADDPSWQNVLDAAEASALTPETFADAETLIPLTRTCAEKHGAIALQMYVGALLYRSGDWAAAIPPLELVVRKNYLPARFWLAMAEYRRGRTEVACAGFDVAVRESATHLRNVRWPYGQIVGWEDRLQLARLRDEAADLLGPAVAELPEAGHGTP